jgi:hypothetical protein
MTNQGYEQDRLLYEQYGTSAVLKKLFLQGATVYNRKRLALELSKLVIPEKPQPVKPEAAPSVTELPLLKQVLQELKPLLDERNMCHSQMQVVKSVKERGKLAFRILDLSDQLTPLWEKYNYVQQHGTLPPVVVKALPTTEAGQFRQLQNLKSQRSKLKKRPDRAADYAVVCQQITELERALKDGNNEV